MIKDDNPSEAEPFLHDALDIRMSVYEDGDWRIAQIESYLGRSLLRQQRFEEAGVLLEKSYPILNEVLGPDNLHTQRTLEDLNRFQNLTSQTQ